MIRIATATEPTSFDRKVRKPGQNALALLEGKEPPHRVLGRRPSATRMRNGKPVPKSLDDFPYWRKCLEDLHAAYGGICAYYCFFIEQATGPTVDHFVAKSNPTDRQLAYEWKNFRLASSYANSCKNLHPDVLDPATIGDGWFQLDLLTLRVSPASSLTESVSDQVEKTISRLKLNEGPALACRKRAMARFRAGLNLSFLDHDHPFVAKELHRQGISHQEQLPTLPLTITQSREPELVA